ncbi:MAG: serine/threonine-protein kinase [Polyangia bacterium]
MEKRLGEGGMGVVYLARHVLLKKPVALKLLRKSHDEQAWKRFVQEAQTASMVNHTNVVAITDFGVISGHPYLVMEFLEGQTLTEAINEGPIPAVRMCRIGAQIARGLHAVHEKGIVHRDLKPDNIFLLEREGKSDVVKIVDFGLAKLEAGQRLTQDGTVVGTAEYISPEQVTGQDTDHRSDQYSLGCILYEMLTSQLPFEGESTATLIYKHVYKNPTSPRKLRPEMSIPASVEQVVLRAMAKKPTDRFKDMRELEQALVAEEMALSPPSETTGHTAFIYRPSGPPPWLRWAALGGAVSSLIFGLLWLALRPSTSTVQAAPDLGSRPALIADLARPAPPADLSVPAPPDAATAPTGPANTPSPNAGGSETPPETPTPGPGPKTRPAHGGRSYAVRLTVEPAAVQAVATCRGRRIACRGSCQLAVPESGGCTVHANGYQDLSLRARDVKGKRALRVVMRALKLGR